MSDTASSPKILRFATIGVSPKAILAFCWPVVGAATVALYKWIESGTFNAAEIKIAVGGLVLSGLAAGGAWVGRPGTVVPVHDPHSIPPDEGDPGQAVPRGVKRAG